MMATAYSGIVPQLPPWSYETKGRYDEHLFESELLKGNPLHDPHQRPLWVYLPPGYDADPKRRYPSIYVIQGLTGQLDMWRNRPAFRCSEAWRPTPATRSSRCATRTTFQSRFEHCVTTITAPSRSSGRASAAAPPSPGKAMASSSTIGAWQPATPRMTMGPSACPMTRRPASSSRRFGSG